jgi:hypothetical protein
VIGVPPPTFAFVRNDALGAPQRIEAFTTFALDLASDRPDAGNYAGLVRARHAASPVAVASAVDAAGGLLALMLMVNLASVLLARAAQREHEFAVSRALGASDVAVMRATLFESGLLGLVGGASGALVAVRATRARRAGAAGSPAPRGDRGGLADWPIGGVIVALGLLLGLLAATVLATWAARPRCPRCSRAAQCGGRRSRPHAARHDRRAGGALARAAQQRGLVVRSVERLLRADPGFRADGVLTFRVRSPPEFFPNPSDLIGFKRVSRPNSFGGADGFVAVYPAFAAMWSSTAETDAAGNSHTPFAPIGFSTVCITASLFRYDSSTAGSAVISNTRPLRMVEPAIRMFVLIDRVRRVFAT